MGFVVKLCAGVVALIIVLTGCDDVGTVVRPYHVGENVLQTWEYAGSRGPIFTQIHGNPFPDRGDEALAARVTDRLAHAGQTRVTTYTTEQSMAFYPKSRLVLLFGALNTHADSICEGSQTDGKQGVDGRDISLSLVMCYGNRAMAMTDGRIPRVDSLEDDSVGWLISHSLQMMLSK